MKNTCFALSLFLISFSIQGQIVINEYSCANLSLYEDNFSKHEDWIELYNTTDSPVDAAGYYVSDRASKPTKWQIPSGVQTVIPAHGFLIIFASNRDTAMGSYFHTNFALKQTITPAEQIVLSNPGGEIIDSVNISPVQLNHSMGRTEDGAETWCVYTSPSPKASNNASVENQYAARPVFNLTPGFYNNFLWLKISSPEANAVLRYTTNGTEPGPSSPVFPDSLLISSTKVIKTKAFVAGTLPSLMEYGTYFINTHHTLPVVSVSGLDITTLLNGDANLKPFGSIEYYDKNQVLKGKSTGEYNRHGKDSWACDQRAIDFIARDEMGDNYALLVNYIPSNERSAYQRVLLRASGDDNYPCGHNTANEGSAHMRDGYIHNLAKNGKLHLDVRSCERVVMYANGEYWGVYEIRENPDEHDYTKYYYDQDKYHIQYIMTWGNTWVEYGGDKALADWQQLYNFIMNHNMAEKENYEYVKSVFNVKSFVDYILVNSFVVCTDWLNYNVGWWRGLNPKGEHKKWGYILWDNDATFAFYINYTGVPDTSATAAPCNVVDQYQVYDDPEGHLTILNKLNKNTEFYEYFVNRQADLLNTSFSSFSMLNYLDYYTNAIDPEMAQHAQRWEGSYEEWRTNVARMRNFISRRTAALVGGMRDCYQLTGPYDLTIKSNPKGAGEIKINSIEISRFPWKGKIYGGINTRLQVTPTDTNKFNKWTSYYHEFSPSDTNKEVMVNITDIDTIYALFNIPDSNNWIIDPEPVVTVNVFPTVITEKVVVDYYLPFPTSVQVDLLNLNGQIISHLIPPTKHSGSGQYNLTFDFSHSSLMPGTYLLNFVSDDFKKVYKIVYLK